MPDIQYFQNQDLVLKVSKDYNTRKLNIEKYYSFLDAIHGRREYNKEASRNLEARKACFGLEKAPADKSRGVAYDSDDS